MGSSKRYLFYQNILQQQPRMILILLPQRRAYWSLQYALPGDGATYWMKSIVMHILCPRCEFLITGLRVLYVILLNITFFVVSCYVPYRSTRTLMVSLGFNLPRNVRQSDLQRWEDTAEAEKNPHSSESGTGWMQGRDIIQWSPCWRSECIDRLGIRAAADSSAAT